MNKNIKKELQLPNLPNKKINHDAVDYINLIYSGTEKIEAFKQVFPDRYKRVHDKAISDKRNPKLAVLNDIGAYESGKYVRELYKVGQEFYFSHFIDKRTKLLNKLFDKAMDDEVDLRDQLVATKIFLGAVPEIKKEDKVVHEIKLADNQDFIAQLEDRKRLLYETANSKDIIDAEID